MTTDEVTPADAPRRDVSRPCPWCGYALLDSSGMSACPECGKTPSLHDDWDDRWRLNAPWRAARAQAQAWLVLGTAALAMQALHRLFALLLASIIPAANAAPMMQQSYHAFARLHWLICVCLSAAWAWLLIASFRTPGRHRALRVVCCVFIAATMPAALLSTLGLAATFEPAWQSELVAFSHYVMTVPWMRWVLRETGPEFIWLSLAVCTWIAASKETLHRRGRRIRMAAWASAGIAVQARVSNMLPSFLGTRAAPGILSTWWASWAAYGMVQALQAGTALCIVVWMSAERMRMKPVPAEAPAPPHTPLGARMMLLVPLAMVLVSAAMWSIPLSGQEPVALRSLDPSSLAARWLTTVALSVAWAVPLAWTDDRRWWKAVLLGSVASTCMLTLGLRWNY